MTEMRLEKDAIGELEVPVDVYWGINTQRAIQNFQISGRQMPREFLVALAKVKKACLIVNTTQGFFSKEIADAIDRSIEEILEGKLLDQFPVDIYQTGSGTQTNMNMNEVLANRAAEILNHPKGKRFPVHPNDHVNRSQSSNDVIPTAMHLATVHSITEKLIPAIENVLDTLRKKIEEFQGIVKVGRTHLQDAVPIPLSLEFQVYFKGIENALHSIKKDLDELYELPIGGTALGTGLNAPAGFSEKVSLEISRITGYPYRARAIQAEGIASHLSFVKMSGSIRAIALAALKMANDIRWMGSGPRAGLGELILPENEPGSSIMPGKVNPTQAEALIQVCIQVLGYDNTIAFAEGFGSTLDLNVTKPLIIVNLLDAINILSNGLVSFTENCMKGMAPNTQNITRQLERSLMIVTKLTPLIGYDEASKIAKVAQETGRTIRETIQYLGIEIDGNLDEILDPNSMI